MSLTTVNRNYNSNAKGNMRQQCMFEGQCEQNLSRPIPAMMFHLQFLRATAATAVVHLSYRNSVCLSIRPSIRSSVCPSHWWISQKVKNGAS